MTCNYILPSVLSSDVQTFLIFIKSTFSIFFLRNPCQIQCLSFLISALGLPLIHFESVFLCGVRT